MDGATLGHFALLEKIGEGGMGRVYKARDTRLERCVAIKVLPESRLSDPDRRSRFVQGAKAASALNYPNIITIHEIGEHEGQTFIVMELVDGKPLNELIPRKGMRLTEALRIFDPKARRVSEPYDVKFIPGSTVTLNPDDPWWLRGPGLVFTRRETTSSVWLMKLLQ